MLGLATWHAFRECARYRVSARGIPGDIKRPGFFDSLGRNTRWSERLEPGLETELVSASLEVRKIGPARRSVGPRTEHPDPSWQVVGVAGDLQLIHVKPLILNYTFGTGTQNEKRVRAFS